MFCLKKSSHSKALYVYIDNNLVDCIHYSNIKELVEILEKYYSEELLIVEDE